MILFTIKKDNDEEHSLESLSEAVKDMIEYYVYESADYPPNIDKIFWQTPEGKEIEVNSTRVMRINWHVQEEIGKRRTYHYQEDAAEEDLQASLRSEYYRTR